MNEAFTVETGNRLFRHLAYQTEKKPDLSEWIVQDAIRKAVAKNCNCLSESQLQKLTQQVR